MKLPKVNQFHDHLDVCAQCANNPFALCPRGAKLLGQSVEEVATLDEREVERQLERTGKVQR